MAPLPGLSRVADVYPALTNGATEDAPPGARVLAAVAARVNSPTRERGVARPEGKQAPSGRPGQRRSCRGLGRPRISPMKEELADKTSAFLESVFYPCHSCSLFLRQGSHYCHTDVFKHSLARARIQPCPRESRMIPKKRFMSHYRGMRVVLAAGGACQKWPWARLSLCPEGA
jgi:hypothetical protein